MGKASRRKQQSHTPDHPPIAVSAWIIAADARRSESDPTAVSLDTITHSIPLDPDGVGRLSGVLYVFALAMRDGPFTLQRAVRRDGGVDLGSQPLEIAASAKRGSYFEHYWKLNMDLPGPGLYWFELREGSRAIAVTPLEVAHRVGTLPPAPVA